MTAAVTLSLGASPGDFIDVRAEAACRGFAGETSFQLARRDLDSFLAGLASLAESRGDAALLLGGWGPEERLRLRVAPAGLSGQFLAHARIANNGPREDTWHRVETAFVCPGDALTAFVTDLSRLSDQRVAGRASLTGDPDAFA